MKVYAIRQKGTNKFLPAAQPSRPKASATHRDPAENGGHWGPRLFFLRKSADQALAAWETGIMKYRYHHTGDWDSEEWELGLTPLPARKGTMEVVEFELNEQT